jgi:hypothetical protein
MESQIHCTCFNDSSNYQLSIKQFNQLEDLWTALWIRNVFFRIRILLFRWFGLKIWILFRILHKFVLMFLTSILPLYSCLLSVLGCSLWRDISFLGECFFVKRNLYFQIEYFCWEIVKFYQFFRVILLQIHFGSRAARIRNDFSGSGSC